MAGGKDSRGRRGPGPRRNASLRRPGGTRRWEGCLRGPRPRQRFRRGPLGDPSGFLPGITAC